jgi:large subunit ribosomal protein L20
MRPKVRKVLKLAKGYRGRAKNTFRTAIRRVERAQTNSYIGRKHKKRTNRSIWIQQINAGTRAYDMPYSVFVNRMDEANIEINRKVVADLAANEPFSFRSIMSVLGTIDQGGVIANDPSKR